MEARLSSAHNPVLQNAIDALRALREGRYSVDATLEVALGLRLRAPDRTPEEHPIIVRIYREDIGEAPRRPAITFTEAERAPIDPDAPVLANFLERWPTTGSDDAGAVKIAWLGLSTAERAAAIAGAAGMRKRIAEFECLNLEHGITPQRFLRSPYLRMLGLKLAGSP